MCIYTLYILCASCVYHVYPVCILCAYCVYTVCIPCLYCVYPYSCIHTDSPCTDVLVCPSPLKEGHNFICAAENKMVRLHQNRNGHCECEISTRNAVIPPFPSISATRVLTTDELCRTAIDSRKNSSVFFKLREDTPQAAGQSPGARGSSGANQLLVSGPFLIHGLCTVYASSLQAHFRNTGQYNSTST